MKDRRYRDVLIPEVLSNEIDNVDTYAQWDKTHYFINITPPKPEHGVTVSSKPDRVTSGQDASIIVDYTTKFYDTTGELNQNVLIGSAMKNVVVNVSSTKKMLPDSSVSGTRPSGIVFTNSDRVKLTISGTPTSDDVIAIDPPIDKRCCVVTPVPNVGYEITADPTIVDELGTNNTAWFASKFNLIIRPDSGHEFVDENIIVSPKSMKDAIVGSFNKSMISLEWDEAHGMTLSDFTIQAPAVKLSGYTVTINLPEGIERESGGELIQSVTIGQEMTQVNLVAVEDLTTVNGFLPADHNTSKDGISINVDTSGTVPYKKAWVSGTPLRATTIDVAPLVVGYAVRITGGAHTTHVSGSLNQFVKAGQPIESVVFRCNDGYWFGDYNGGSNNSVSISLNDAKTEIILSGRPASMDGFGSFDVRLEDAIPKPVTLTVNLPNDGSVKVKAGEENRLNQSIDPGEYINGITLVPKDANYKMTQDWRQTITVEPANEHIMMMTSDTETYISGRISENTVITVPALKLQVGVVRFVDWPNIPDVILKAGECLWDTTYNYKTHELIDMYNTAHPDKPCTWVESTLYPNVNFNATQLYMPEPPININVVAKFGTPPNDYGVVTINNAPNGNALKIDWYPDEGFDIHMSNGHIPLSNDGYFTELYLEPNFKTLVYSLITEHPTLGGPDHWWMPYPAKDMTMYAKFVKDESKYLTIYWGRDPNMNNFAWSSKWKTPIPWKVKAIDDPNTYICDPSSITFDSNYHEMGLTIGDLETNRPVYSANYVDIQMWDPDPQYSSVNSFALSYSGDGGEEWNRISIYEPEDTIVPIEIGVGTGGTTEYRLQYTGWGDIEPPPPDAPTTKPDEPGPGK